MKVVASRNPLRRIRVKVKRRGSRRIRILRIQGGTVRGRGHKGIIINITCLKKMIR